MIIINILSIYLLIGTIFTCIIDMINNWLAKKDAIDYDPPTREEFGISERLISIVAWPFAIYIFTIAYFKK